MSLIGQFLYMAIEIYIFIIIANVIVSWLIVFNVISMDHPAAKNLVRLLGRLTDPVVKSVQRYIPPIGGIDITPIVIIFGLVLIQKAILHFFIINFYF